MAVNASNYRDMLWDAVQSLAWWHGDYYGPEASDACPDACDDQPAHDANCPYWLANLERKAEGLPHVAHPTMGAMWSRVDMTKCSLPESSVTEQQFVCEFCLKKYELNIYNCEWLLVASSA